MPSHSPHVATRSVQAGLSNAAPSPSAGRWEVATFALVIAAGAVLRLVHIGAPIWLDEAWVANSVLEPTLKETLHFDQWVQTTPPMLLVLLRWAAAAMGTSEVALRVIPWLGGMGAVACFAAMARKVFSWPLALGGTTLLASNLYAARQAVQVKQYSTDLLVACLFLWCLWRLHKSAGGTKEYVWLLILGSAGVFLSYPALFWLPAALLAIAAQTRPWEIAARGDRKGWLARQWPLLVACMVYGLAFIFVYLWFIAPNQTPDLVTYWGDKHLGSVGKGLADVLANIARMVAPQAPLQAVILPTIGVLLVVGALRAAYQAWRGIGRGRWVLLGSVAPIVAGLIASAARRYPVLEYPRLILWMLPCVGVLLVYAVEPAWQRLQGWAGARRAWWVESALVPGACLLAMMGQVWAVSHRPQEVDDIRAAASYVREHAGQEDGVYVPPWEDQALRYYQRRWNWFPSGIYFGSIASPSCRLNPHLQFSFPSASTVEEDVREYVARLRSDTAWAIGPSWSDANLLHAARRMYQLGIPKAMEQLGCRQRERKVFRRVQVWAFACGTGSAPRNP